jgi:hypothetical protein
VLGADEGVKVRPARSSIELLCCLGRGHGRGESVMGSRDQRRGEVRGNFRSDRSIRTRFEFLC